MTLNEELAQAKARFTAAVPEAAQANILRLIKEQQQSGIAWGLQEGAAAPDFSLPDPRGGEFALHDALARGPVVLTFYRGGWCPFCSIQLRAYQRLLPDLRQLGARLIAVSPQSPDHALTRQEKEGLAFAVLSDPDGRVAEQYNLLYELPLYLQDTYGTTLGRDLAANNQSDRWLLPVPATYVIDRAGVIRSAWVNPDFMERMEPGDLIERLKKLR